MKKEIIFCLFLLLITSSCDNNVIDPHGQSFENVDDPTLRSSGSGYTLFQNIDSYVIEGRGDSYIEGKIYCPSDAVYTFIFAFNGDAGVNYYANLASSMTLRPTNGGEFRTVMVPLKKGVNHFHVGIDFNAPGQVAEARLVVTKINGQSLRGEDGYVDLALYALSQIFEPGEGGEPFHWTCTKCQFTNSTSTSTCASCGNSHDKK